MADLFNALRTADGGNTEAKTEVNTETEVKTETKTEAKTKKTKTPKTPKDSKPLPDSTLMKKEEAHEVHDIKWAVKEVHSDAFKLNLLDRIMWSSKQRKVYAFLLDKKERIYALVMFTNMVTPSLIVHELCQKIDLDFDSKSESSILKTHVRQMRMTLRKTSLSGRDIIIAQVDE